MATNPIHDINQLWLKYQEAMEKITELQRIVEEKVGELNHKETTINNLQSELEKVTTANSGSIK